MVPQFNIKWITINAKSNIELQPCYNLKELLEIKVGNTRFAIPPRDGDNHNIRALTVLARLHINNQTVKYF